MIIHTLVPDSCFYEEIPLENNRAETSVTKDMARFNLSKGKITAIFSTNPKDFLEYSALDELKG